MHTLLIIVHSLVCLFLIVIVLLQHGKGASVGASFGGSGQTVFGTEGPLPLLNKITTASAIIFMFTSVTLAYYSASVSKSSVMKTMPATAPVERQIETAPKPVEVPLTAPQDQAGTNADTKTSEAPAQFPGAKADATDKATEPGQEKKASQPQAGSK